MYSSVAVLNAISVLDGYKSLDCFMALISFLINCAAVVIMRAFFFLLGIFRFKSESHAEREPITGVWGAASSGAQGQSFWLEGLQKMLHQLFSSGRAHGHLSYLLPAKPCPRSFKPALQLSPRRRRSGRPKQAWSRKAENDLLHPFCLHPPPFHRSDLGICKTNYSGVHRDGIRPRYKNCAIPCPIFHAILCPRWPLTTQDDDGREQSCCDQYPTNEANPHRQQFHVCCRYLYAGCPIHS